MDIETLVARIESMEIQIENLRALVEDLRKTVFKDGHYQGWQKLHPMVQEIGHRGYPYRCRLVDSK